MEVLQAGGSVLIMIKSRRNVGIELLRIVLAQMIIILHLINQGGGGEASLNNAHPYVASAVWLLKILTICGVDCFALISGYVGWRSKLKISHYLIFWLQLLFFAVIITFLTASILHLNVSKQDLLLMIFPIESGNWWYASAYFGLMLLIPFINVGISTIAREMHMLICVLIFVLAMLLPHFLFTTPFGLNGGYSTIWLMLLYIIGAYIGKYGTSFKNNKNVAIIIFVICNGLAFLSSHIPVLKSLDWISYTSPTAFGSAIALLMFFSELEINADELIGQIILFVSPSAFSIYLIHVHPLVFANIIKDCMVPYVTNSNVLFSLLSILIYMVIIFIICFVIDLFRRLIFSRLSFIKQIDSLININ